MIFASPFPARAQNDLKDIPDPDPALELASFKVADGFEVNLFATDPMVTKPIQMNFDERGRLWVAGSSIYPHIQPGEEADDKVYVLEDTDHDGRADKSTVFTEGLLIPTGLIPGDGGLYVANSTELLHMTDTDGDGRADKTRVVLSGFGTEDTHHILHTFRWNYDGQLCINQSIYIHSHIETPWGPRRLNAGGVWQFRPEAMRLEVYARGLVNSWGHHFDRWGADFLTDGAGGEGINYAFPGAAFMTAFGVDRILAGLNPGSPKHCSLEALSGRGMPEEWRGSFVTNDFRGHRVCRFALSEDGSGFASREMPEIIKTSHVAFRPVDAKMGPDGALYIADWYNPIIQHGEVDFRDARRDHAHGRIWRVTAKGRPALKFPNLVDASNEQLLNLLGEPEDFTRAQARRMLRERGLTAARAGVISELGKWTAAQTGSDEEAIHRRLEALWVYQGLDEPNAGLLLATLESPDPRARAAAVRVVPFWAEGLKGNADWVERLGERAKDPHARVRLEAARALATFPEARAARLAMAALDQPVDRFADYALWQTARDLKNAWMPELAAGKAVFEKPAHAIFALQAVGGAESVGPLVSLLESGTTPADQESAVLEAIAARGGPEELAIIFDAALAGKSPAEKRARWVEALAGAARKRAVRPKADLTRVSGLLGETSDPMRAAASRAAGAWNVEGARPKLIELAGGAEVAWGVRAAAIEGLSGMGAPGRAALETLAANDAKPAARLAAAAALAALDLPSGAALAARALASAPEGVDPGPTIAAFMAREGGAKALAGALAVAAPGGPAGASLKPDVAKLAVRAVRTSGRPEDELIAALTKAGSLGEDVWNLNPDQVRELVAEAKTSGDAARGERLFRSSALQCLKCHAIGGAGGRVGPDMSSLGASAQPDYILEAVIAPSKAIKENYHSLNVTTKNGEVISGIKVRQTADSLILRDGNDLEVSIPASDIDKQEDGLSLMPSGMVDAITRAELADLVRFLTALGREDSATVKPGRGARTWRALMPSEAAALALHAKGYQHAADTDDAFEWTAFYVNAAGDLPLDEAPRLSPKHMNKEFNFLRFEVDVTTPGEVGLKFDSVEGVTLWVDGSPVEPAEPTKLKLEPGRRQITLAVAASRAKKTLSVEVVDIPGSKAQAMPVGGK